MRGEREREGKGRGEKGGERREVYLLMLFKSLVQPPWPDLMYLISRF